MRQVMSNTAKKIEQFKKMLVNRTAMLIVLQDNPDPDAIAASLALRKLANALANIQCSLASGGTVGRAENRAMVRYLNVNLRQIGDIDMSRYDLVAMVDTQPGTGNNSLPGDAGADIVIDHHPIRSETRKAFFTDVRSRYGATSSILYEYLSEADVPFDPPLATALLYGIRSDTQDLGRDGSQADIAAYGALYPLANKRMLSAIQRGQVPDAYFQLLAGALINARLCENAIYCELGDVENPDMIAEIADLLLRHEQANCSLCWGYHKSRALLSFRTSSSDYLAGDVIRQLVQRKGTGGGHDMMAGGQIALEDNTPARQKRLNRLIRNRYFKAIGVDPQASRKFV